MPHEGERARHIALGRIVENERVRSFLSRCVHRDGQAVAIDAADRQIRVADGAEIPRFVVAVDGSYSAVTIETGFPGAELGFVSVATVLLDVDLIDALRQERTPDPAEVQRTTLADGEEFVLPGSNVQLEDTRDPKHSFRRQLHDALSEMRCDPSGETLLDTYHVLLGYKSDSSRELCPYDPDCGGLLKLLKRGHGEYTCECVHSRPLYGTDALRIHEAFNPSRSSGEAYGEAMRVVEHLTVVNFLRTVEAKGWLDSLRRIAIVLDGPLGVFGHPAWLKDAIQKELQRINGLVVGLTGRDMLLLGIEKTGQFMEHFVQLDTTATGSPGRFPAGSAMLLRE